MPQALDQKRSSFSQKRKDANAPEKVDIGHFPDCIQETKRCLLLGGKAMTNLDSVLKNRDITLLTKVCIVKAMIFPVVTYRCESWTINKVER